MKTAVLINYSSNNGNAAKRWAVIENDIRKMLPPNTCFIPYETPCNLKNILQSLIVCEKTVNFVSAGGDGSLNCLINELAEITGSGLTKIRIGAIGLGSSNDFHKPFGKQVRGIPVKIDFTSLKPADAGLVQYQASGENLKRIFVINASLGFTAMGNLNFNNGDRFTRFLKPRSVQLAILWTIIKTVLRYRNQNLEINCNSLIRKFKVTNLSIAKNPHVSGNFSYDIFTPPDSGKLGLYLAEDFSRLGIVRLFYHLSKNRFSKVKNCCVSFIENAEINSAGPVELETDGEVFRGNHFCFSVLPKVLMFAG